MSDVCNGSLVLSSTAQGGLVGEEEGKGRGKVSRWRKQRGDSQVAVAGRKVCSPGPLAAVAN